MTNKACIMREVKAALAATGQDHQLVTGSKHIKVILAGRQIGVLCKSPGRGRDAKQILAAIRRRMQELKCAEDCPS